MVILGEAFEWFHAIGGAVILARIYLATVATTGAAPTGTVTRILVLGGELILTAR